MATFRAVFLHHTGSAPPQCKQFFLFYLLLLCRLDCGAEPVAFAKAALAANFRHKGEVL